MKYCIYKDQPMPTWARGEQVLTGCEIFGVHHNCEGCPNLKEMGDNPYNSFSTMEEKDRIDEGFTKFMQNGQKQPAKGFDKDYLNEKIAEASETWKGVDVDKYMDEVRGREHIQPEVDIEKFTEKIKTFQGRYKHPESISIKGAMSFMARMFYQYPNVARLWYEQMPKATMDNARKEETK